jgi:hypothetical protein
MFRLFFIFVLLAHGLIHLLGFVKAFEIAEIKDLQIVISRQIGLWWLFACLLLITTSILYLIENQYWWLLGMIGALLSQILIMYFWNETRFGTIPNLLILIASLIGFANWNFEDTYVKDVKGGLQDTNIMNQELILEEDLQHLPLLVQDYLKYVGVLNKPRIENFKIVFEGEMRGKNQDWFRFTSEQYNFRAFPQRLFFMKAVVNGLPTYGYHSYKNGKANMLIKILSVFPVVNKNGKEMDESELVTYFNDLCLFAPSMLIDKNIQWEEVDASSVRATIANKDISISAILMFNDAGQLINFISDDRYDMNEMEKYRFSTPASDYENIGGYNICTYGEAMWHYPDGDFTYGKFNLKDLKYNL